MTRSQSIDLILILLPIILELIKRCRDDSPTEVADRIRNPGPFATMRLARAIKRERRLTPSEWRAERGEIFAEVRNAAAQLTDEEVCELIQQTEAEYDENDS